MALALEASSPLPDGLAEALSAARLDLIRTNSVERAVAILRSILIDALVVTLDQQLGEEKTYNRP
jgi:hypothetical protein